jgi:cytidylate kinase
MSTNVPVIAIDGPSASGKGTVAQKVAQALGFHYLDMKIEFRDGATCLDGADVTQEVRTETVSTATSQVAANPAVRRALLKRQRGFLEPPGLVADGRDMGSVVFPEASLKVYLTADVATRAERRHKQLMEKGMYAKMEDVVEDLRRRDARDSSRAVAPLKHYPDAIFLDTTGLAVDAAVQKILDWWRERASR